MFEERPRPRRKLPARTLILMVIALLAFLRMWWVTVEKPARERKDQPATFEVVPLPRDGGLIEL